MQSDNNEIYRLTAERTKEDQDLYKDIGNYIFKSLYNNMKNPKSIILKLKGLGYWYLRKTRIEFIVKKEYTKPKQKEGFFGDLAIDEYNNKIRLQNVFKERLVEYEEYVRIKKEVKKLRNEYLESINREDPCKEESQNNI